MGFNNQFPSQEKTAWIRSIYPKGCRVELVHLDAGTVRLVDDTATVFVDWDSGSGLGIIYGVDRIRKI